MSIKFSFIIIITFCAVFPCLYWLIADEIMEMNRCQMQHSYDVCAYTIYR
jgi:hypothetical protein